MSGGYNPRLRIGRVVAGLIVIGIGMLVVWLFGKF
jgi:hypothetical protein